MSLAERLAAKKAAASIPKEGNEAEPINNLATTSVASAIIHDRIVEAANKQVVSAIAERIKEVYTEQLLKEGEEVRAIDLVDHSLYPSGYIPVDAIAEKQKEIAEIQKDIKQATALAATQTFMEKMAAARAKAKAIEEEKKHEREAKEAEASKNVQEEQHGLDVQSESLSASKQSLGEESKSITVAEEAFDAKDLIAKFIEEEKPKLSLKELLALKKHQQEAAALAYDPPEVLPSEYAVEETAQTVDWEKVEEQKKADSKAEASEVEYKGAFSLSINLNEKQLLAKEMALSGKTYCLIGPAGSGKTTAQRSVAETLLQDKRLKRTSFKIAGTKNYRDAPSIAFVAYTRRASANLQRAIHKNPELEEALRYNIMTIHALLEFEPEFFWDDEKQKESMRFAPQRNAGNPLTITNLVIEEASMLGLDLWQQLWDALPTGVQIIFIGDINQLPPVFGASILNYALIQTPVVELTEVYRQAGDSLVLANAHHILKGEALEEGNGFTIVRGKNAASVGQEKMSYSLGAMFKQYEELGIYDHEQDMILSPFNKQLLGTDNMNKWISQFLSDKRQAIVFEVIAGFNKLYLAEGDKVMYNKQDAFVVSIYHNPSYHGKEPQMPGADLSRFGVRIMKDGVQGQTDLDDLILGYENFSLEELADSAGERKMQSSHIVRIRTENGQTLDLSAAGDFSPQVFSLGYVLTVHKAQGCEWRKVFIILHKDHSMMLTRELFYTAVTRAREECIVIAKDYVLDKAIKTQRIKGNTLEDKIEYFNSGALDVGSVYCTK